jgi:serine/alanine adding enzyme
MSDPVVTAARLHVQDFRGEDADWNAFVADQAGASFCHLAAWRGIMADVMGQEPVYRLALDDEGRWRGALPLVRVRSMLFGHYIVSMPFLNYGGPLGDEDARAALARDAMQLARSSGAGLLELRARGRPVPGLRLVVRKVTVTLPLPGTADALWAAFPSKLRTKIRRPGKEGMAVRFGAETRPAFYEVFCQNMRDLGTPVLPAALFQRIERDLGDDVVFGAVYQGDVAVAAGCALIHGREMEMTWSSSLRRFNRFKPIMLLYWAFMERAVQRGLSVFNFGRCTPGGGTHDFKLQWGGEDEPLPWGQWSARGLDATPNPTRPAYRLAAGVWSHLPRVVSDRLGPPLARRIP